MAAAYFSTAPAYYHKALSHAWHLLFLTLLAGRNDYSWFPEEGTETARSCDLSEATELGCGSSPLTSMPRSLSDNISSFRKRLSQGLFPTFVQKPFIHWAMIMPHIPGAGIKREEWTVAVLTELTARGDHSAHIRTIPTQWSEN